MKIVIVCAFYDEILYYKDKYNIDINKDENKIRIGNKEVLIVKSLVGKVNAALTLQRVIDTFKPDYILNSGCAGAIKDSLNISDVIIIESSFYHDFTPINIMEKYTPNKGKFLASDYLITKAKEAFQNLNMNYKIGAIATGDCYVTDKNIKEKILNMGAICTDMETASFMHVAAINNIPFLSIRGISDFANGEEVDEINSSYKAAIVTEEIIKKV